MGQDFKTETIAIHQNFRGDETNSIVRGIHPTSAYHFNDSTHGAQLFDLSVAGNIYSRLTNPTNDALGQVVSDLEGGIGGLAVSSGSAALNVLVMTLCKSGDHIFASKSLYGGTVSYLKNTISKFGVSVTFVDQDDDYDKLAAQIRPETKIILAEAITNPRIEVLDVDKFAKLAKDFDIPFVLDSTFTPPAIFKPFEHGINIIIHSATKYLGGHGNSLAGIIVDGGSYNWDNGKFPELSQPDDSYHGLVYTKAFGNAAFLLKARAHILRDTGSCLSPFDAFLILTGIQTLFIRLEHVSKNALSLAQWLEAHPCIEWVSYPLLESHKNHELAKKYLPNGAGGILAFGVKGDRAESEKFINSLKLGIQAVNVGDVRTIVTHPASTTHRQLSEDELVASGISGNLIRISIGLENLEDIKTDLDQALRGE